MFTDDQDIDHELRAALNVEPSAGFGAGVRRRIETNRPQRGGRSVWFAAAAAVLLVIAGAWLALPRGRTIEPPPAAVAVSKPSATSQGDVPKSVVQPNSTAQQALGPKPERGPVANVAAREQKPEVLVPAGQLALIQRLQRQANSGQVEVPAGDSPSTPPVELVVTPVFIAPIAVAGAEPGGGTSPGPKGLQ